jgi:hypothetical protein
VARRFAVSALNPVTEAKVAETTEEERTVFRAKIQENGWKEITVVDGQIIFEVADDDTPTDEISTAFQPDGGFAIGVPPDYPRQ